MSRHGTGRAQHTIARTAMPPNPNSDTKDAHVVDQQHVFDFGCWYIEAISDFDSLWFINRNIRRVASQFFGESLIIITPNINTISIH